MSFVFAQVNFEASGNGDGGPVSRSVSRTVYSSVYQDFCGGQPTQVFFHSTLCSNNLLASAGQTMDDEAISSSDTPGTTVAIGFRGKTAESLRAGPGSGSGSRNNRAAIATQAAIAAASALRPPEDSPETKKVEKRKLNALAQYAESKANTAKTAEQMALESRIETKTLELDVQSDASPSKAAKMRMLRNMQKRADKLEGEHYGAASLDFDDERNAP